MPASQLTEDEFRILAYVRAYADHRGQSLDPSWVQGQLEMSLGQLREAARGLVKHGLAEFFEYQADQLHVMHGEFEGGLMPMDIRLTDVGWNYLRGE